MKTIIDHNRITPPQPPKRDFKSLIFIAIVSWLVLGTPMGESALEALGWHTSEWQKMVETLNITVNDYEGEVGIYIKDLNSGKVFEHQADQKFISASLIKLPIMAATFQAVREKKFTLDTKILLKRRHWRGGSGKLKWAKSGNRYHASYLIYQMITKSDNTATAMLIDKLGYEYLNKSFRDFGLLTTRIDPVGMSLADHVHPARDNYTTPREMGRLLEGIYDRNLVSDGLSDLMLEILKDAHAPNRLARFLPDNWSLARKTGLLRKNCHDVGIVFTDKSAYVICVLTSDNQTYNQAKGIIASIGKAAYFFMGHS